MAMNVQAIASLPDKINQIRLLTAEIVNKEILPNENRLWRVRRDGPVTDEERAESRELRRGMGYLFQHAALINWLTAFENVAVPLRETTTMPFGRNRMGKGASTRLSQLPMCLSTFAPEARWTRKRANAAIRSISLIVLFRCCRRF